ncbi:DNA topoisomerase IB [Nocardia rosealba]|uniref:DNA topoisomerase IB n=1 Tax=Nocardia rosealba TaxID=2878563 RepID=UPI001CD91E7C|nr:DNA topoisomerase IB [Nocardia rosealba]MCA2206813.1 DNA topoisomerase IB [Nocardia rosealba]
MRLRRSTPYGPGIRRVTRGRGFSYLTTDGEQVSDEDLLERINGLVIPPAWRKVWICPHANGHIQAVGVDAAGRRQYLYHEQWRRERDEEKFDRVLDLAGRLPPLRDRLTADVRRSGLHRHRVEAVAIGLIDLGVFRVGGEEYAEENGTRGVATLLREQVRVEGEQMLFDYVAKGGLRRRVRIHDADLTRAVASLRRSRADSPRLLVYRDKNGYRELHADDINARFKALTETDCTVKDLRTWQATVLAAEGFAHAEPPTSERARKRAERAVIAEVAAALGNTPAVARASYIDPRVGESYADGVTISRALDRAARVGTDSERRAIVERAVLRLLRRAAHRES